MSNETTITMIGNLTADPELRWTQNGLAVANFTVASTPRIYDKQSGEWKDGDPLFIRCSAWREMGEHITESLIKGSRVVVVGSLKQKSYETKEGEKRTTIELDVEDIGASLKYHIASPVKKSNTTASDSNDVWAVPPGAVEIPADDTPF